MNHWINLKRRKPVSREKAIIPLINIVFLLLIFFIMSANFTATPAVNLPKTTTSKPQVVSDEAAHLTLHHQQHLTLNHHPLLLEELSQYLQENHTEHVVIETPAHLPAKTLMKVVKILAQHVVSIIQLRAQPH